MRIIFFLSCILFFSCKDSDDPGPEIPTAPINVNIVNAFPDLGFSRPLDLQSPADDTNRIFVAEQGGLIKVFPNQFAITESTAFLSLGSKISSSQGELGLLGLTFHPDYATNGFFYVCYTASPTLSVISRFSVSSGDPNVADANSELVLIEIPQPRTNHNGGQLAFGPDGYLYIASGDGGDGGASAQDLTNLLGTILRIDVNVAENGQNYGIPVDNPYVNETNARPEIFAHGLRNPWRMSFDPQTGTLWAGDVGEGGIEEINRIEIGNNYGWNIYEGTECRQNNSCNTPNLTAPYFEYTHANGDRSITGGYVYRGTQIPELIGRYVYADFITGRIWALSINSNSTPDNELLVSTGLNISSFGTDAQGELFICAFDGAIYRLEAE